MGKRLMSQNRGKGTPTYRATSSRFKANLEHIRTIGDETINGVITEVIHDTARNAPITQVRSSHSLSVATANRMMSDSVMSGRLEGSGLDASGLPKTSRTKITMPTQAHINPRDTHVILSRSNPRELQYFPTKLTKLETITNRLAVTIVAFHSTESHRITAAGMT